MAMETQEKSKQATTDRKTTMVISLKKMEKRGTEESKERLMPIKSSFFYHEPGFFFYGLVSHLFCSKTYEAISLLQLKKELNCEEHDSILK